MTKNTDQPIGDAIEAILKDIATEAVSMETIDFVVLFFLCSVCLLVGLRGRD